jgi:[ribosomal protein S5]-alanine N-acetyltransferase
MSPARRVDELPGARYRDDLLVGRPPARRDVADLGAMLNDPAVVPWLGGGRTVESVAATIPRARRHWSRHGWGGWVFHDALSGQLVGRGGLATADIDGRREIEVMYTTRPEYWGRGFGTTIGKVAIEHARRHLNVASVVAFTLHDNVQSRRVMEKLGFEYESDISHADLPHVLYRLALSR